MLGLYGYRTKECPRITTVKTSFAVTHPLQNWFLLVGQSRGLLVHMMAGALQTGWMFGFRGCWANEYLYRKCKLKTIFKHCTKSSRQMSGRSCESLVPLTKGCISGEK